MSYNKDSGLNENWQPRANPTGADPNNPPKNNPIPRRNFAATKRDYEDKIRREDISISDRARKAFLKFQSWLRAEPERFS